jgi:type IV secretion system protein VirD4
MEKYFIFTLIMGICTTLYRALKFVMSLKWFYAVLGVILGLCCINAETGILGLIVCALFIYGGVKLSLVLEPYRERKKEGESQQTTKNVKLKMSNNEPCGVVFGTRGKKYIIKPGEQDGHILVVGGAGSGKTSCVVIPTLRAWKSSVFAIDIKGELKDQRRGRHVKIFDPTDPDSYGYNPFYILKNSNNPAQEAEAIVQALIPEPKPTETPFWIESARGMLAGAILHFYKSCSFIETLHEIQNTRPRELIDVIYKSDNPLAKSYVTSFIDMENITTSGIHGELSIYIRKFVNDNDLKSACSRLKFITPDDLESQHDIFVFVPEHNMGQWKNLLTLMINQFLRHFEQRPLNNKTPILFMLDEFPRLGQLTSILDGVATLRGRKITVCPIIQNLSQLDVIYGHDERKVIVGNCSYKAVLSVEDADTQEYFSKMYGTFDKPQKSEGESYTGPIIMGRNKGYTTTEKRRIKPEDFATLPSTPNLVMLTPYGNFKIKRQPWYKERKQSKRKSVIERLFK